MRTHRLSRRVVVALVIGLLSSLCVVLAPGCASDPGSASATTATSTCGALRPYSCEPTDSVVGCPSRDDPANGMTYPVGCEYREDLEINDAGASGSFCDECFCSNATCICDDGSFLGEDGGVRWVCLL